MKTNKVEPAMSDLNDLVSKLQKEDRDYARFSERFSRGYLIITVIYLAIAVIDFVMDREIYPFTAALLFTAALILTSVFFKAMTREYGQVDYSVSLKEMLQNARYRFNFGLKRKDISAYFLMMYMVTNVSLYSISDSTGFWKFQLIFFLCALAVVAFAYVFSRVKYGAMLAKIDKLLSELGE